MIIAVYFERWQILASCEVAMVGGELPTEDDHILPCGNSTTLVHSLVISASKAVCRKRAEQTKVIGDIAHAVSQALNGFFGFGPSFRLRLLDRNLRECVCLQSPCNLGDSILMHELLFPHLCYCRE